MKWLRTWWNRHWDLPKRRGGNWQFIPLEVRDTQHESYGCWVFFLKMSEGRYMGPQQTLNTWCAFLKRYRRMQTEYFAEHFPQ